MTAYKELKSSLGLIATVMLLGSMIIAMPEAGAVESRPTVDFQREVRPILSDACFGCHGPDAKARKGRLRLDVPEGGIFSERDGVRVVQPGKPDESELVRRIASKDPDETMPPPKHTRQLKPAEIDLITRWVAEGAKWQEHWSLVPPRRPALPAVRQTSWPRNAIDAFILARLEKEDCPLRRRRTGGR